MNHTLYAQCQNSAFCPKVPFDEDWNVEIPSKHTSHLWACALCRGCVTFPRLFSLWWTPRFPPYPCISQSRPKFSRFVFQAILGHDLHKQISENVHKINDKSIILGIWRNIDSPNRVGARGLSVPDESVKSNYQTFTKFITNLSRGAYSNQPAAWQMTKARLSAAFQQS